MYTVRDYGPKMFTHTVYYTHTVTKTYTQTQTHRDTHTINIYTQTHRICVQEILEQGQMLRWESRESVPALEVCRVSLCPQPPSPPKK